jgi:hypothetical protein
LWSQCMLSQIFLLLFLSIFCHISCSKKTKNPGVFSSRVLGLDTVVYYVRTLCLLECYSSDHRHVTRLMSGRSLSWVAINRVVVS